MRALELKALRQLLFFSVDEAAQLVAVSAERPNGVTGRTWRHWEDGRNAVPDDVAGTITGLTRWRAQQINAWVQDHASAIELTWYDTPEEWATHSLVAPLWRPHQSALAHLAATLPNVLLVPYKPN